MKTDVFSGFLKGKVRIFCGDDDELPFGAEENADWGSILAFIKRKETENTEDCSDL